MPTIDKLIKVFPIQTCTPIFGLPTYESIKKVNDELSKNTATISTTRGVGNYRYLAITVFPTIYATLSPKSFTPPTVHAPPDLAGMTGPQILAVNRAYDKAKCKHEEYLLLQNRLKRLLINVVQESSPNPTSDTETAPFGNSLSTSTPRTLKYPH